MVRGNNGLIVDTRNLNIAGIPPFAQPQVANGTDFSEADAADYNEIGDPAAPVTRRYVDENQRPFDQPIDITIANGTPDNPFVMGESWQILPISSRVISAFDAQTGTGGTFPIDIDWAALTSEDNEGIVVILDADTDEPLYRFKVVGYSGGPQIKVSGTDNGISDPFITEIIDIAPGFGRRSRSARPTAVSR